MDDSESDFLELLDEAEEALQRAYEKLHGTEGSTPHAEYGYENAVAGIHAMRRAATDYRMDEAEAAESEARHRRTKDGEEALSRRKSRARRERKT